MMANGGTSGFAINVTIPSEQAREFLTNLANDPDTYARFQEDPKAVLEEIEGVELTLPEEPLLPEPYKPPTMEHLREFLDTGYPPPHRNPPPYNGGCRMWSILYAIASQTEHEDRPTPR